MLKSRDYECLLPKVLDKLFPDVKNRETAIDILNRYTSNELYRVKVGILKASNGNIAEIERLTELACCDWRDLLVEAEFPLTYGKRNLRDNNPERYRELGHKEVEKYDKWLKNILTA